jgi:Zn-finger nucleic acid-binding protein
MILACPTCDGRYDVTGHPIGQQFRCRCGTIITLEAPSRQADQLACPHCGAGVSETASTCTFCTAELLLKACPRCLSRVFHGHKHCPECGAELSVVATTETHAERPCPRCVHPLGPRLVNDIVIDECMSCRGLFLDHIAIKRIVTDRQQARAEALLGALPRIEHPEIKPADGRLYIKCPICHVVMNRKLFATGAGVIIDVCRTHGTFFDAGELPRIIEFVMNGGLEQSAKKDVERMRDDARRDRDNARYAAMAAARTGSSGSFGGFGHHYTADHGEALVGLLFSLLK